MTALDHLQRIKAYCDAATAGPWSTVESPWRATYYDKDRGEHVTLPTYVVTGWGDPHAGTPVLDSIDIEEWESPKQHDECVAQSDADLTFASKARTDLPRLVKALEHAIDHLHCDMEPGGDPAIHDIADADLRRIMDILDGKG